MHEAKTHLSRLVQEVEAGGKVTITRNGEPVVELVRATADTAGDRGFGAMKGRGRLLAASWEDWVESDAEVFEMFFGNDE